MDTTSTLSSIQLARALAQSERRKVFAALVLADGELSTREIEQATGLGLRVVVEAIDRLVNADVVVNRGDTYALVNLLFETAARAEVGPPSSAHADQPTDVARVLDFAFRDDKLVQWPAKRAKRLVVLDHLAQVFEIGLRYSESEINELLRPFNEDVATSRRYLVDEQFLDRGEGRYWRCGGSI